MPRLTNNQLNQIEQEAINNAEYKFENEIRFGKDKCSILRVSSKTGLILIQGDQNTGYIHIVNRHTDPLNFSIWQDNIKKSRSSKLSIRKWRDIDFINIADDVYDIKNLKRNSNNYYDLFEGSSKYFGKEIIYKLLVYKSKKVIHNLFPIDHVCDKYPKDFPFFRGSTNATWDTNDWIFSVPYFNNQEQIVYKTTIILNLRKVLTANLHVFQNEVEQKTIEIPFQVVLNISTYQGALLIPFIEKNYLWGFEEYIMQVEKSKKNLL